MAAEWNVFRYLADFSHLISVSILLYKMLSKKTCRGVSLKTQILYLIVYCSRYLNSGLFGGFSDWHNVYNCIFKFFYMGSAVVIVVLMMTRLQSTYEKRHDTFKNPAILVLSAVLAAVSMPRKGLVWFFWSFSLWVEALAIIPQLILVMGRSKSKMLEVMNREYIFFMSIYRLFYLINWVYKMVTDTGRTPKVVWITGILQTVVYSDFIYMYLKTKVTGTDFELPYQ